MKPHPILHQRLRALLGSLVLAGVLGLLLVRITFSSPEETGPPTAPSSGNQPQREIRGEVLSPDISFIDSPSPTCSRREAGTTACYIQWNYLYVYAAPSAYIISLTLSIDNHLRAYHAGFFQPSLFIPASMTYPGYKVTCGAPGSSGVDGWGYTYAYTIRARETTGLTSANSGSVICPADTAQLFMPLVTKR